MALGLGAALGIGTGVSLLSDLFIKGPAASRQQKFWKNLQRQRQSGPEAAMMRALLGDIQKGAQELPGQMRGQLAGRLATRAQVERQRIGEALARGGVTGASELSLRAQRGVSGDIERQRQAGQIGIGQLGQRLQMGGIQAGQSVLNALFPQPGQTAAGAQPQTFFDPSNIINSLLIGGLLGKGGGALEGEQTASQTIPGMFTGSAPMIRQ